MQQNSKKIQTENLTDVLLFILMVAGYFIFINPLLIKLF
jgi:hypothetical protein